MLPLLKAERQLAAIEAASVPHMDKDGHRSTIAKYMGILGVEQRAPRATLADLEQMGIKVKRVPKRGTTATTGTGQDETGVV